MFEKTQKYTQKDLVFGKKEKIEKVEPFRGIFSREGADDRFSEKEADIELYFDGKGGFFVDEKKVSVEKFLDTLGRGASIVYNRRPELEEVFKKALYYEKLRTKTKTEFDEVENEKMQQALNKE